MHIQERLPAIEASHDVQDEEKSLLEVLFPFVLNTVMTLKYYIPSPPNNNSCSANNKAIETMTEDKLYH